MGTLIVIDAPDGAGKQTQVECLKNRLEAEGKQVRVLSYPTYGKKHAVFVEMYLNGEFGTEPSAVNAKLASSFYALNRYADYMTDWKTDYDNGTIMIADRYTTANMIHQAAKLQTTGEKDAFVEWVSELEYEINGIPRPNAVIYLDVAPEITAKLRSSRANKINGSETKDIHEKDLTYMRASYDTAIYLADKQSWITINCVNEKNELSTIHEIHELIYQQIKDLL